MIIQGPICNFGFFPNIRKYTFCSLPYSLARRIFKCEIFRFSTGDGNQRRQHQEHVQLLRDEILNGNFTPVAISASINSNITYTVENDIVSIVIPDGCYISLLDGGHRFAALEALIDLMDEDSINQIANFNIIAIIYLNGDLKKDFCNLQKGLRVDRTHLLSLLEHAKREDEKLTHQSLAIILAEMISSSNTPFYQRIRFDDSSEKNSRKVPLSTLIGEEKSWPSINLTGTAMLLNHYEKPANFAVKVLEQIYNCTKHFPVLSEGFLRVPDKKNMLSLSWIGLLNVVLFRLLYLKRDVDIDSQRLIMKVLASYCTVFPQTGMGRKGIVRWIVLICSVLFEDFDSSLLHYNLPRDLLLILKPRFYSLPPLRKMFRKK
ncbi:MAG: DNA sulfur modification protein DndB [Endomicrobiia bacterium]